MGWGEGGHNGETIQGGWRGGKTFYIYNNTCQEIRSAKCNIDNIDNIEADNDGTWLSMTPENECYVSRKGGSDEGLLAIDFTHCTHSTRALPIFILPFQGRNFGSKALIIQLLEKPCPYLFEEEEKSQE